MDGARICRIERYFSADSSGISLDGFHRGFGFEGDVVHAFRVFEVELLRSSVQNAGKSDEKEKGKGLIFHDVVVCCFG